MCLAWPGTYRMGKRDETESAWVRAAAAREAFAGRGVELVAALTGVSTGTASKLKRGTQLGRRTAEAVANGLRLSGPVRERFFRSQGFTDPGPVGYDAREYYRARRWELVEEFGNRALGLELKEQIEEDTPKEEIDALIAGLRAELERTTE